MLDAVRAELVRGLRARHPPRRRARAATAPGELRSGSAQWGMPVRSRGRWMSGALGAASRLSRNRGPGAHQQARTPGTRGRPRRSTRARRRPRTGPSTTSAAVWSPRISPSTSAGVDITAPIPWAKRFGRARHGLLRPEPRRDHVLRGPAERAQRRAGQDARPEPVRERNQQPVGAGREDHEHGHQDHAGDDARRLLVDRIRKRKQLAPRFPV